MNRRALLVGGVAVTAVPLLGLTVAVTGEVAPDLLMRATAISIATVALSVVTALLVTKGLPQLVSRHDRGGVAVVCGALSVMYVAVAVFLMAAADDAARVTEAQVLVDRDDFIAWRDDPHHRGGVLLQGTLTGPETRHGVVASHACVTVGSRRVALPGGRLPENYLVDVPGGPPIVVDGIGSGIQAWGWPPDPGGECVLRRGDRVLVWGDLQGGMGGGATSYTGLADVRIIAVGDATGFLQSYPPAVERTGRVVLALAAVNGALAAMVAAVGVRTWRRLSRTGTDEPPRITWRTGPR